jgi:hypothetical protein
LRILRLCRALRRVLRVLRPGLRRRDGHRHTAFGAVRQMTFGTAKLTDQSDSLLSTFILLIISLFFLFVKADLDFLSTSSYTVSNDI